MNTLVENVMVSLEYMAGLLDGEGSVGYWSDGKNKPRRFVMQIRMTAKDLIAEVRETFGGSIGYEPQSNPNHNDTWVWRLKGKRALALFDALEPSLRVKKRVAPDQGPSIRL